MTLAAFRIVKKKHVATAFTGDGARLHGGRWNRPGTPVIYASSSIALAMLEMLVHLTGDELRLSYVVIPLVFESELVTEPARRSLPRDWRRSPSPPAVQAVGDRWVAAATSVVLRLPSAIVPAESNFLLNPAHPDFRRVSIGKPQPIRFDRRLA